MSRRALSTLMFGITVAAVMIMTLRTVHVDRNGRADDASRYPRPGNPVPEPSAEDRVAMLPPAIFLPTADAQPLPSEFQRLSPSEPSSQLTTYDQLAQSTSGVSLRLSERPSTGTAPAIREPLQVASAPAGASSGSSELSLSAPVIERLPPVDDSQNLTSESSSTAESSPERVPSAAAESITSFPPVTSEEPPSNARRSTYGGSVSIPEDAIPAMSDVSPWVGVSSDVATPPAPAPAMEIDTTPLPRSIEPVAPTPTPMLPPISGGEQSWPATESLPPPAAPVIPQQPAISQVAPAIPHQAFEQPAMSRSTQAALAPVMEQARAMQAKAFSLAQRGAWFTSRAEIIESLRLIAQSLDALEGTDAHTSALTSAIVAIKEADDFSPRASRLEGEVNVVELAKGHRTPVLHGETQLVPAISAMQMYYNFAQKKLIAAGGGYPESASGMYLLGRLHQAFASQSGDNTRMQLPKAMVFHQAAVMTNPKNHLAANELGVLMAKYGQLPQARDLLVQSVMARPHVAGWQNLAEVHRRLGQIDLAKRAEYEKEILVRNLQQAPLPSDSPVAFVSPEVFTAQSGQTAHDAPAARTAAAPDAAMRR